MVVKVGLSYGFECHNLGAKQDVLHVSLELHEQKYALLPLLLELQSKTHFLLCRKATLTLKGFGFSTQPHQLLMELMFQLTYFHETLQRPKGYPQMGIDGITMLVVLKCEQLFVLGRQLFERKL